MECLLNIVFSSVNYIILTVMYKEYNSDMQQYNRFDYFFIKSQQIVLIYNNIRFKDENANNSPCF